MGGYLALTWWLDGGGRAAEVIGALLGYLELRVEAVGAYDSETVLLTGYGSESHVVRHADHPRARPPRAVRIAARDEEERRYLERLAGKIARHEAVRYELAPSERLDEAARITWLTTPALDRARLAPIAEYLVASPRATFDAYLSFPLVVDRRAEASWTHAFRSLLEELVPGQLRSTGVAIPILKVNIATRSLDPPTTEVAIFSQDNVWLRQQVDPGLIGVAAADENLTRLAFFAHSLVTSIASPRDLRLRLDGSWFHKEAARLHGAFAALLPEIAPGVQDLG